jgi:DUF1009 family protein
MIPAAVLCTSKANGRQSHSNCVQMMMHRLAQEAKADLPLIKVLLDLPL